MVLKKCWFKIYKIKKKSWKWNGKIKTFFPASLTDIGLFSTFHVNFWDEIWMNRCSFYRLVWLLKSVENQRKLLFMRSRVGWNNLENVSTRRVNSLVVPASFMNPRDSHAIEKTQVLVINFDDLVQDFNLGSRQSNDPLVFVMFLVQHYLSLHALECHVHAIGVEPLDVKDQFHDVFRNSFIGDETR